MLSVSLLHGLGITPRYSRDTGIVDETTKQPIAAAIGDCAKDNLGNEYVWTLGTTGVAHWERKRAGYTCPRYVSMTIIHDRVCSKETPENCPGGTFISPATVMNLGPWTIPLPREGNSYSWLLDDYNKLTPEMAQLIGAQLMKPIQDGWKTPYQVGYWNGQIVNSKNGDHLGGETGQTVVYTFPMDGSRWAGLTQTVVWPQQAPWGPYLTWRGWADRLGIWGQVIDNGYLGGLGDPALCGGRSEYACATTGSTADRISPIAKFKHPETGEDWGLWVKPVPVGPVIAPLSNTMSDGSTPPAPFALQSIALRLTVQKIPEDPWYKGILQVLFYVPTKIFDVAIATAQEILGLACTDPAKAQAAAAAAGPEAIAAVTAALALCPRKPPDTPPPEEIKVNETTGKKALPWGWIAVGVAAVGGLAAFLMIPPKKKRA